MIPQVTCLGVRPHSSLYVWLHALENQTGDVPENRRKIGDCIVELRSKANAKLGRQLEIGN